MTRLACQYAIIRFLPYAETGEFANVGVLLACPTTGYLDARLLPTKNTGRITAFFDQLDKRIYRDSLMYIDEELERIRDALGDRAGLEGATIIQQTFAEIIRPREALLRFSETRVILADNEEQVLDKLFARFIGRDFVSKQYHDRFLERGVRRMLAKANLRQYFKPAEIGNDYLHATVPFVYLRYGDPALAIKPLDLAKDKPNQVFEHGGHWVDRIRRLRKHDLFRGQMLFAVEEPTAADDITRQAAKEIIAELRENHVEVVSASDFSAITAFAAGATSH
jgi:hypothetical protein